MVRAGLKGLKPEDLERTVQLAQGLPAKAIYVLDHIGHALHHAGQITTRKLWNARQSE